MFWRLIIEYFPDYVLVLGRRPNPAIYAQSRSFYCHVRIVMPLMEPPNKYASMTELWLFGGEVSELRGKQAMTFVEITASWS
jgi:hypothetical protein